MYCQCKKPDKTGKLAIITASQVKLKKFFALPVYINLKF